MEKLNFLYLFKVNYNKKSPILGLNHESITIISSIVLVILSFCLQRDLYYKIIHDWTLVWFLPLGYFVNILNYIKENKDLLKVGYYYNTVVFVLVAVRLYCIFINDNILRNYYSIVTIPLNFLIINLIVGPMCLALYSNLCYLKEVEERTEEISSEDIIDVENNMNSNLSSTNYPNLNGITAGN
jgi:hypothetical protein